VPVEYGNLQQGRVKRLLPSSRKGKWMSVGPDDMPQRLERWTFGLPGIRTGKRVPLGRANERLCCDERSQGLPGIRRGKRVPVGRLDMLKCRNERSTDTCSGYTMSYTPIDIYNN